ncbi:MAG TPA: YdeI/OmpD-associated family protein [Pyrinomonadaceae bacterium]|nr:YdeI/OmpD-associated family protein [Pyrinomonadaceae bacterium]
MKLTKFKTTLIRSSKDSGWHFVDVPGRIGKKFEKKDKSRRVVCTINGTETFQCALLPSDGDFVIVVNKTKRDRLRILAGDKIVVELKADESKYGLPMPPEFKEVLRQDGKADKLFHALTAGKQRSVLYLIGKIKDIDRRIHAALVFVEHIKKHEGAIVGDELYRELKRPIF